MGDLSPTPPGDGHARLLKEDEHDQVLCVSDISARDPENRDRWGTPSPTCPPPLRRPALARQEQLCLTFSAIYDPVPLQRVSNYFRQELALVTVELVLHLPGGKR